MAAKYDFKVSPNIQGTEEQPTLYPKIVVSGTMELDDIAEAIAKRSSFKVGTIIGLFSDLENVITDYLANGYNVKLGKIGTFSATLTSRKVKDKKEIRASSVHFDTVKFKPTRHFLQVISGKGSLERVAPAYGFKTSSDKYSKEERFDLLTAYLKEHPFITRKEYSNLTGLLKTKAANELREWSMSKKIKKEGGAPHIIYRKAETEE